MKEEVFLSLLFLVLTWHLPEYGRGDGNINIEEREPSSSVLLCSGIEKEEQGSKCTSTKPHLSVLTHFTDKEELKHKSSAGFSTKQKPTIPGTHSASQVHFSGDKFNLRPLKSPRRGGSLPRKAQPALLQASAIPSLIVSSTSASSLPQVRWLRKKRGSAPWARRSLTHRATRSCPMVSSLLQIWATCKTGWEQETGKAQLLISEITRNLLFSERNHYMEDRTWCIISLKSRENSSFSCKQKKKNLICFFSNISLNSSHSCLEIVI